MTDEVYYKKQLAILKTECRTLWLCLLVSVGTSIISDIVVIWLWLR